MTQFPPPPSQPFQYATPSMPTPPTRPTSVTVLSVIGIIFGALGLLCTPFSLIPFFVDLGQPNPVLDVIKENQFLFFWTVTSAIIGILMAIVLLAGSIGSLKLAPWARQAMLAYAALSILLGLIGLAVQITMILPAALEAAKNLSGPQSGGAMGGAIGGAVGAGLGMLYPIFVLIFYNKENVKAAFAQAAASA